MKNTKDKQVQTLMLTSCNNFNLGHNVRSSDNKS